MSANVMRSDIVAGLRDIGLRVGDVVMVHGSLSSFGRVEGGVGAVVEALVEVLGAEGTLVAPTFGDWFQGPPEQVWDREKSPSRMGAITETVRTWPGAMRSSHPGHPFSAVGKRAREITGTENDLGWGPGSPLAVLEELDGRILLLGVDYNCVTLFHLPEAEARVPYRRVNRYPGTVVIDGVARPTVMASFDKLPGLSYDFRPLGGELEEAGFVRRTRIGECRARLFDVRSALALERRRIAADPLYLLSPDSRERYLGQRP